MTIVAALTRNRLLFGLALGLAVVIFAIDLLNPLEGAVAVLYVAVVLLLAPVGARYVILTGLGTAVLTALAFAAGHIVSPTEGAISRFAVSLVAIAVTTVLSLRDRSTRTTLGEQARLLELSHDTVIIRDTRDVILYWNDGAEKLYGWPRREAVGQNCAALLQDRLAAAEVEAALQSGGQWSGEIVRARRDGTRLVLASRWLLRRDPDGRAIGVIESSADLTQERLADVRRRASEERYRTIFESAGFATWESDWSATMRAALDGAPQDDTLEAWLLARPDHMQRAIGLAACRNANLAAMGLFDATSEEQLAGADLCGRYLPDSLPAFAHIIAALAKGARAAEREVRLLTLRDRIVDIVLHVTLLPEGDSWSHMLVMAHDVTERNQARARLEQTSADLAHAGRVSILGQLAASIAHEVNQPLTAIINYGKSGQRWLGRAEPDLGEVADCLDKIIASGSRAAAVIARIRALARKAAPQAELIDLRDLIEDTVALIRREAQSRSITVHHVCPAGLPLASGDRVQVQQVLVNLMMNGLQAMREVTDRRLELCVSAESLPDRMIRVSVRDCGAGFPQDHASRVFEPFFTTRPDGMGMGLSICRSIVETQGGRISAANNADSGATVDFTLPMAAEDHVFGAGRHTLI